MCDVDYGLDAQCECEPEQCEETAAERVCSAAEDLGRKFGTYPNQMGVESAYVPPRYEAMPPIFQQLRTAVLGEDPTRKMKVVITLEEDN